MAITIQNFPSLAAAAGYCDIVAEELKAEAEGVPSLVKGLMDIVVVGSYGRGEASRDLSDFEWILVYNDRRVAREEAIALQSDITKLFAVKLGRGHLSISKTFGEMAALSALMTNVGGQADTNQTLTYRMLTLAEGRSLTPDAHANVLDGLARTYGDTHTSGHRLLSLATDVARYWRTLRIDYKFKVDETRKPWALRNLKLRSFRRFWYFSSAVHFVAFGPRVDPGGRMPLEAVARFVAGMGGNPTTRLLSALNEMGCHETLIERLLRPYDEIHRRLSEQAVRETLDRLQPDDMEGEPVFTELRRLARDVHRTMAMIVLALPEKQQVEMLEMFLL